MKNKVEYTELLISIGIFGFINGIILIFFPLFLRLSAIHHGIALPLSLVTLLDTYLLLGIFLLLSSVLFLTVRKEVTYLMYTGMFAILCIYQTIILPHFAPSQPTFPEQMIPIQSYSFIFWSFISWLIFGYLIYKYFNLKTEFRKYEKPYGHEREKVESEDVPYYYKVLGVSRDASQEEIKRAYYRLVRIYHPDVSADPEARRKFEEIRKAYEVLSDPEKRAKYDKFEHAYRSGRY